MLDRLLEGWTLKRAARAYALRLGPQLAKDYGAGDHYTAAQIEAAAARAKLATSHLALGYAGFMTESEFDARKQPGDPTRDDLRALLDRYRPDQVSSDVEPAPENAAAMSGGTFGF